MKKYFGNSIMVLGCFVLVFVMFYVFSVYTHAGNTTNAGSTGNVTAIVQCENPGDTWQVDHAQVAINADGCNCEAENPDWPDFQNVIDCDNDGGSDDFCTECLASFQRAGLTIIGFNGFFDGVDEDEKAYYTLTGNSGPFLNKFGGSCPCD